jgi:hypothetical protein
MMAVDKSIATYKVKEKEKRKRKKKKKKAKKGADPLDCTAHIKVSRVVEVKVKES